LVEKEGTGRTAKREKENDQRGSPVRGPLVLREEGTSEGKNMKPNFEEGKQVARKDFDKNKKN